LLVGGNDTGKTSVLEALILLLGDGASVSELPIMFRNNQSGGQPGQPDDKENFWYWLFYDRDPSNQIEIQAQTDDNHSALLSTHMTPEGNHPNAENFPVLRRTIGQGAAHEILRFERSQVQPRGAPSNHFRLSRLSVRPSHPVTDAEKYNQIALESDGEMRFERLMREVEPRLKRLRYAKLPGTTSPLVFADIGLSRAVPATQMGQAFNRTLHIYAEILTAKTNVLLIDEIENGIFSDSLELIWKGLLAVCEEQKVQVFATTHSRECVMAANAVAHARGRDELCVQRLQFVRGQIEAVRLGIQHLDIAAEMGLEVRS
jgi:hypothetical protein